MSDDSNESMSQCLFELNWCEESKLCSILQQCSEENMNMKLGHEHSPLWWETPCIARILQLLCNRRTNELLSRSIQAFTASQALPGAEASQLFFYDAEDAKRNKPYRFYRSWSDVQKRGAFKDGIFTCEGCNIAISCFRCVSRGQIGFQLTLAGLCGCHRVRTRRADHNITWLA